MREAMFIVLLGFFVFTSFVEGRGLPPDEDLELEMQLKKLNKPAIKTVKTKYGDIYDCVDFYKQPAFDHPLLKNHSFHFDMRLNSPSRRHRDIKNNSSGIKGVGCPRGSVPIRRTTKEDLIRLRNFTNIHPLNGNTAGLHYAGAYVRPEFVSGMKMGGAEAYISIEKPPLPDTRVHWFSSGLIKISNGPEFIKAGWMVDPLVYGDDRPRLFTLWIVPTKGCYDARCPGFVSVNQDLPLGYVFREVSKSGEQVTEMRFLIQRETNSGNWFLSIEEEQVGFWPGILFKELSQSAGDVFFGGEVFTSPGNRGIPVGNGLIPEKDDPDLYAHHRQIAVLDDHMNVLVPATESREANDIRPGYVRQATLDEHWGRTVMYGGPGVELR